MPLCTTCRTDKSLNSFWFNKRFGRNVTSCLDCAAAAKRRYRTENVEAVRLRQRRWQRANPDKMKDYHSAWCARNPGIAARRTAVWRAANRERALAAQRACDRKLKDAAYAAYGGYRCACCGETTTPFLSIDHINNDGANHRKGVKRRNLYKWLKANQYPPGFQILCMNCNFGKARNRGVCPHIGA